jgi:hypothetical protein
MTQPQTAAGSFDDRAKPRTLAEWQRAHDELQRLARTRAGLDFEEGQWLVRAHRSGVHERLGFGSFSEYVGRLFGYGARLVQEKLRVAEALERLPELAEALKQGRVCWSALRELTRVATPETEAAWLATAKGRTVRELEKLVSGLAPGSQPGDLADPKEVRRVLRFEVTGDVLACVREALMKLRRMRASRWTTKPRCCSWPARCSKDLATKGAPATKLRSQFASTATAASKKARASRRRWIPR